MVVVPHSQSEDDFRREPRTVDDGAMNWARIAAAGTLIAGGVLLVTGQRRAGLAATVTGATLALLDQRESLRCFWNALPGYIDDAQRLLGQIQATVEEIAVQRERLRQILER
jgi:hypothetical protein